MGNSSEKKSCLNSVVQWCFCVFTLIICGYSLVRQQSLEQRLKRLEEWHLQTEDSSFIFHQPKEEILKRDTRDVTDCICPPAPSSSIAQTFVAWLVLWIPDS
ncbi:unnamed protein product, partial [Brenthis ino]